jgi:large subunit ribosomal protein L20
MPRVKGGPRGHARHKKIFKLAKGYRMTRHTLYKKSHEAVERAGKHAYEGRKQRRRDLRRLWIARINGALSQYEVKYSRFINALKKANINLNRKVLSEMAINDPASFTKVVESVKSFIK